MPANEHIYKEVINKIIEIQMRLMGSLALTKAKSVENLQLDNEGKVIAVSGDPIHVIRNLVLKYGEMQGETATAMCKIAISKIKIEHPGLELPPELM